MLSLYYYVYLSTTMLLMFKLPLFLLLLSLFHPICTCDGSRCLCLNNTCNSCLLSSHYNYQNQTCLPCPIQCSTCQSPYLCTSCRQYYYLSNGTCLQCPQNCLQCTNLSLCSLCQNGYRISSGVCIACSVQFVSRCDSTDMVLACLSGYWQNGNSCSPCRQFCLLCSSPSNCLTCQSGYRVAISFGSYCSKCTKGCSQCSATICNKCLQNYQLSNGICVYIGDLCAGVNQGNCQLCNIDVNNVIVCLRCKERYYLEGGQCVLGASVMCQKGATGRQWYQCDGGCGLYGYLANTNACIPYVWTDNIQQTYLTISSPILTNHTTTTNNNQYVYHTNNGLSFNITLTPYYRLTLLFEILPLVTPMAMASNISITLKDNSSSTQTHTVYVQHNTTVVYQEIVSNTVQDTLLTITMQSTTVQIGLKELLIRLEPCPANCHLCYNAQLCYQCNPTHFSTPDHQCLSSCQGYLLLYVPSILNPTHKQCLLSCPPYYYPSQSNSTYLCQPCQNLCLQCLSQTQCTSCIQGYLYYQIDFGCVEQCPSTHYNVSGVCQVCVPPCYTCVGVGTVCSGCSSGYLDGNRCVQECPMGTYADTTSLTCMSCDIQCISCTITSSYCHQCNPPFLLHLSQCLKSCPQSHYPSPTSQQCLQCQSPCLTCTSQTRCLSCSTGFLDNQTCISSCSDGYYADSVVGECVQCQEGCLKCSASSVCLQCGYGFLYGYQCVGQCGQGTYPQNGLCIGCLQPCSSCLNATACLSCSIGYLSLLQPYSCLPSCQPSYYPLNATCLPCPVQCPTCTSPSICTSCLAPLILQTSICVTNCSVGLYDMSGVCVECGYPCGGCYDENECYLCGNGFILVEGNCVTQCPSTTYNDNNSCLACIAPCLTCTSPLLCLTCLSPYLLHSTLCLLQCPAQSYADLSSSTCQSCPYPCSTCLSSQRCLSCITGYLHPLTNWCQICQGQYYSNYTSGQCQLCGDSIQMCVECITERQCSKCQNSMYLDEGKCVIQGECSKKMGYYADNDTMMCSQCVYPCLDCGSANLCLSCQTGLLHLSTCLSACPQGYYSNQSTCLPCLPSCLTCLSPQTCQTCNPTSTLSHLLLPLSLCTTSCPSTHYLSPIYSSPTCLPCLSPCLSCINSTFCLSCVNGLLYLGDCVNVCPSGYYLGGQGQCVKCSAGCFGCENSSQKCTGCRGQLLLKGTTCVSQCGSTYYLDSYILQCFPCVSPCLQCTSSSSCLSCQNSTLHLYSSQCLHSCPSQTYPSNSSCLPCPIQCTTCLNSTFCTNCISTMFMSSNVTGVCVGECGGQEYGDRINGKCYGCVEPCVECLDAVRCTKCVVGYLKIGVQCQNISRCPTSTYRVNNSCQNSCASDLWAVEMNNTCQQQCSPPALKTYSNRLCALSCPPQHKIDQNYTCTPCTQSSCIDLLSLQLQTKTIFNVLYLKITFSSPLPSLSQLNTTSLTLTLTSLTSLTSRRLQQNPNLNYSISSINLNALWLKLELSQSVYRQKLTVEFADYYLFEQPLQKLAYQVVVQAFDLYSKEEEEKGGRFQMFGMAMSVIMLALFVLDLILNRGYLSYNIIDYYQLLFLVLFLSIDFPPPLNHFLYGFRYSHYLFLPSLLTTSPTQEYTSATPDQFGVVVPDVMFIKNGSPSFIVIAACLGVLVIGKMVMGCAGKCRNGRVMDQRAEMGSKGEGSRKQQQNNSSSHSNSHSNSRRHSNSQHSNSNEQGRCSGIVRQIVARFKYNYFNDTIYLIYFSIILFSFAQLYDLSYNSTSSLLSILLSFLFLITGLAFPFALARLLHLNKDHLIQQSFNREVEEIKTRMAKMREEDGIYGESMVEKENGKGSQIEKVEKGCFMSGVRIRVRLGFYHIPIRYFRKLILACLMVYCSQYPSFVLGIIQMLTLFQILSTLLLQPYLYSFQNYLYPLFDLLYLLIYLTICIMQLSILQLNLTQKINASYFAISICIVLTALLTLYNLGINVVEIGKKYWGKMWLEQYRIIDATTCLDQEGKEEQSDYDKKATAEEENTQSPMKKIEKDSQSMISGFDLYLKQQQNAPKYLIKCLKQPQEPQDNNQQRQIQLKIGDIHLDHLERQIEQYEEEKSQSIDENKQEVVYIGQGKKEEKPVSVFMGVHAVNIEDEEEEEEQKKN